MIYVLDTDILSLLAHKDSPQAPRIRRRIVELPAEHFVVTTVINCEEQMRGWMAALSRAKSSTSEIQIYARLLQHLSVSPHVSFGIRRSRREYRGTIPKAATDDWHDGRKDRLNRSCSRRGLGHPKHR